MPKLNTRLVVAAIAGMALFTGITFAQFTPSSWVSTAAPSFTLTNQLPDSVSPPSSNFDCDKITTRFTGSTSMSEECVVQTPLGLSGSGGIIFTGSSEAIAIVPPSPYNGLRPIPNQEMFYTLTSAPVTGLNLHIYTSIRDKMKPTADYVNGRWQYTLTKGPDFMLKSASNKPMAINLAAMAFSPNGSWMVVDIPFSGFVRVNLATFEITPFAPSLNAPNDYSSYSAQLTVSNDGRYVALKPSNASEFRIYDMASCQDAVLPVSRDNPKCQSRDYWPYISSQLPALRMVYQPRFIGDMRLSLIAMYNYAPGSYKVAQYVLTAPGEDPGGIDYLGMGDSFASGQGAFNYILGTDTDLNTCHLSSLSYPFLLSSDLFSSGHSVACSGAKMRDIIDTSNEYEGQSFPRIDKGDRDKNDIEEILVNFNIGYMSQTEFVTKYQPQNLTLSIGGNDIGFSDIVTKCVTPAIKNTTCFPTYEDQLELVKRIEGVENRLKSTYRSISSPGRKVYIIGYPQMVVHDGSCAANVHLDEQEISLFIDLTTVLNQTIKRAAEAAGVQYVDVTNAFVGHRMCETKSSQVAVNGFTVGKDNGIKGFKFIGSESYHPNALGHELLAQAIKNQTNNFKSTPPPSPNAGSDLPYAGAPKTGRSVNITVPNNELTADVVTSNSSLNVAVPPHIALLKPQSIYTIKLDDDPTALSTITTDASGNLNSTLNLPSDTPCGIHTIHLYGQNLVNQPIDIFKIIHVQNQDGSCPELNNSSCGLLPMSGIDIDKDTIDDACDPLIAEPPEQPTYSVHLTGSSIHAVKQQ